MAREQSYVGPGILKLPRSEASRKRIRPSRKASIVATVAIAALLFSVLVYVGDIPESDKTTKSLSVTILGIALTYQYYDTVMACQPCLPLGLQPGPHNWNHAAGANGAYGDGDDCPHCSAYCAPASISMIANYRLRGLPFVLQDFIYDNGKSANGEFIGNGIIETHGVGMFHGVGVWPPEVQTAMIWALGGAFTQHDWNVINPKGPMTYPLLLGYMSMGTPILWLDNGGWPVNQSTSYPPLSYWLDQGHAKVIGGHDDNNTPLDPTDDLCLIFDPWPEYSQKGILPFNCTQSSPGVWDPYWQPLNDVNFSDVNDVYLADQFPAIPEFTTVLVPVIGMMAIVAVAFGLRREQDT